MLLLSSVVAIGSLVLVGVLAVVARRLADEAQRLGRSVETLAHVAVAVDDLRQDARRTLVERIERLGGHRGHR